jgi:hypothetical protein
MSSSNASARPFFLIQTGVAAWEDPKIIDDYSSKTISVCALDSSDVKGIMFSLLSTRPAALSYVTRCHIAPRLDWWSDFQLKRFAALLARDPPGFTKTSVQVMARGLLVVSELIRPELVNLDSISSYRWTILLMTDADAVSITKQHERLFGSITEFRSTGLAKLRERAPTWPVLRLIESETHTAVQMIGPSVACDRACLALKTAGVRQITDEQTVPNEIARWHGVGA